MHDKKDLEQLASQLSHPSGESGKEVGEMMNRSNINMTRHSFTHLKARDGDRVLELGHGNGKHLEELLLLSDIDYYGLEVSALMQAEAEASNQERINEGKAHFSLYDGENIPFPDHYFQKVFTVNTIYFWKETEVFLNEIYRVMSPGGQLNITFALRDFMESLPFTSFGFTLYDHDALTDIISRTPFKLSAFIDDDEVVTSKTGETVTRSFSTLVLKKTDQD